MFTFRAPITDDRRASQQARAPKLVAVFLRRLALEKHAAHELLRDRRAALRENRAAAHVVAAPAVASRVTHAPTLTFRITRGMLK